jgi:hypothetical protein
VLSIVQLKTAALDYGIPGVSPIHMLLLYLMAFAIPMIPYAFLYLSLRDERGRASLSPRATPILEFTIQSFRKTIAWMHAHRHPELLHH